MLTDEDLIAACLAGRKEAWGDFVDRFSKLIFWSIQRTLKDSAFVDRQDLASELFQDFFTQFLEKTELGKLRHQNGLRRFLVVKASHLAMNRLRDLGRQDTNIAPANFLSIDQLHDTAPGPSASLDQKERNEAVESVLRELSPKQRACVEWYLVDEKTHEEISQVMGIPIGTVSSVIQRTREKLKSIFTRLGLKE